MKKITAIIVTMAMVSIFVGCQKQEPQKPAEQSAPTATAPAPSTPAPEKK